MIPCFSKSTFAYPYKLQYKQFNFTRTHVRVLTFLLQSFPSRFKGTQNSLDIDFKNNM